MYLGPDFGSKVLILIPRMLYANRFQILVSILAQITSIPKIIMSNKLLSTMVTNLLHVSTKKN